MVSNLVSSISKYYSGVQGCWFITIIRVYQHLPSFSNGISHNDDILGVLSLIFYTITLITLIKRDICLIFSLMPVGFITNQQAEDHEVLNYELELLNRRGTFALYSLLCRYAKVGFITNQQAEDHEVLNYELELLNRRVILILLFAVQRFGTDKVGYTFALIICIWFAFIGGIGIYNFIKYDFAVAKAINPKYIIDYFRRNKKSAWVSLGGVVLAITSCNLFPL
ncbi:potassium transporter 5 [Quercus suber]|uniref:Potassium transporter 5 n=1 Tax=Quercus suber TaxID=58331 RepID=A0AAW0JNR3_QUESU